MFDYLSFDKQIDEVMGTYNQTFPYPYAYFDNLFDEAILDDVNREIDEAQFTQDVRQIDGIEVKTRSDFADNESLPPITRRVFELLNGGKFLTMVSKLTDISGLISDPYYDGGGINIIQNQGTLAVHVDGTTQHRMRVCRRINAILFLNDDWDPNWNGITSSGYIKFLSYRLLMRISNGDVCAKYYLRKTVCCSLPRMITAGMATQVY